MLYQKQFDIIQADHHLVIQVHHQFPHQLEYQNKDEI
jgi:hypothetical protein